MSEKNITAYLIVNPAAGDDYFDRDGVATTANTQPRKNLGRAHNLGLGATEGSAGMSRIKQGKLAPINVFGSQVIVSARQGVQGADVSGAVAITSAANSSGLTDYTLASHVLVVGESIVVLDTNGILSGPQRVVSLPDANSFVTDKPFVTGAGTLTYGAVQGDFATMTAGRYLIRRQRDGFLRGQGSTLLRSGASDYGIRRSIHKAEAFRDTGVAAAVRAGFWDIFSGVFSTAPTVGNDSIGDVSGSTVTDGTADHAATPTRIIPGELVFRQSGVQTAGEAATDGVLILDYPEKTG